MSIRFLLNFFLNFVLKLKYRKKNIRFLRNSYINGKNVFEGFNSIGENTKILDSYVGLGTYTGSNVYFNTVKLGRFCSIGSNVKNIVGRHPLDTFVTTHPAFFSKGKAAGFTFSNRQLFEEKKFVNDSFFLVEIGSDVWIADNVTILDNVKIGNGAIVGANSLVTKDIPPYSINVGIPAKTIRYRFDEMTIEQLEKLKWWNWDMKLLARDHADFNDISLFIKKYEYEGYSFER